MALATRSSVLHRGSDSFFRGTGLDDSSFGPSDVLEREQRLWIAVIARCILDAEILQSAELRDVGFKNGRDSRKSSEAREKLRSKCRRWLIADYGDYVTDRETVCDLAGLDGEALRRACQRRLDFLHGRIPAGENVLPFDRRIIGMVRAVAPMMDAEAA